MIPNLTVDMTATLAPFGYAALSVVAAGFIAVISAAFRTRVRRPKLARRYALLVLRRV
jgi:hypothetical protein